MPILSFGGDGRATYDARCEPRDGLPGLLPRDARDFGVGLLLNDTGDT